MKSNRTSFQPNVLILVLTFEWGEQKTIFIVDICLPLLKRLKEVMDFLNGYFSWKINKKQSQIFLCLYLNFGFSIFLHFKLSIYLSQSIYLSMWWSYSPEAVLKCINKVGSHIEVWCPKN